MTGCLWQHHVGACQLEDTGVLNALPVVCEFVMVTLVGSVRVLWASNCTQVECCSPVEDWPLWMSCLWCVTHDGFVGCSVLRLSGVEVTESRMYT
jgi:hypothetical protein